MPRLRLALAYSVRDPAGSGAAREILGLASHEEAECPRAVECYRLEVAGGVYLAGYEEDTVNLEFIDETPDPHADAVVILSRHSSSSGRPSLTVHHTGNPTSRTLGGEPRVLSVSAPPLSRALLRAYRREAEEAGLLGEYEVSLEATHHGPTRPGKPLVFIEIGSTPDRWRDRRAREAMARAVLHVLEHGVEECEAAAGFGESHYPRKFTEIHLDGPYCMGHIIPRYAIQEGITPDVVRQAIEKTWPEKPGTALVHKKSLKSATRRWLVELLESLGVSVETL
ncbi:MAG: D-aminoacyl-tRNA deacylase [Desulfurococcales archaeon]|nr:D-aminoacyl-tRNA deacylase [Desulfurococcales archaeon]